MEVVLFDQGGRGPGGRASHRRVHRIHGNVLPDDEHISPLDSKQIFQFDHGCQFFCAWDDIFTSKVQEWMDADVVAKWEQRSTLIQMNHTNNDEFMNRPIDFFGILSGDPCYIGKRGMHSISRYEESCARSKGAIIHRSTRVMNISSSEKNNAKWELTIVRGPAALHDTSETMATATSSPVMYANDFDAVIVTDASCSFDGWHRASAGISTIAPSLTKYIRSRARIPLFSSMVALDFSNCKTIYSDYDALVFETCQDKGLWFAAQSNSKPGFESSSDGIQCWTLVSSPAFAVDEISLTTMQGISQSPSGENVPVFKPQENSYLNAESGPAARLVQLFLAHIMSHPSLAGGALPKVVSMQGQRWGSALPGDMIPSHLLAAESVAVENDKFRRVMGVWYQREIPQLSSGGGEGRSTPRVDDGVAEEKDFLSDDVRRLYYAGDFCSPSPPGVQTAALSAFSAARHIIARLKSDN
jgi:hypothetical protein